MSSRARRAIAVAMVTIIVALVAAFLVMRRQEPAARPVLTLRVNRAGGAEIAAGTPLTFEIFLTATTTGRPVSIGSAGRPWHGLIQLASADADGGLPWTVVDIGTPRSTRYATDGSGRPLASADSPAMATVSGLTSVHVVTRGVSPEDSARAPAGVYRVRAVLSPPWWMVWRWNQQIMSAPVTVTVAADTGVARRAGVRTRESAAFYLEAHRYADARQTALAWLQAEPDSSDAYAILAEAQEGEGQRQEAMASYQKALALRGPSREEPRYLEERLSALMRATGGPRTSR